MLNKKITFILVFFIISIGTAPALSVSIDMAPFFELGDKVFFDYNLSSDIPLTGKYWIRVSCPNVPPLLEENNFNLSANQSVTRNYIYLSKVSNYIEPQICNASIIVFSPVNLSESKSFEIKTDPLVLLQILTCRDKLCLDQTRIFLKDETIYLDYRSEILNPYIVARLVYPDGKNKELTFPTSIKAEQIGTYSLRVFASKEDYQTTEEKMEFGVIEIKSDFLLSDFTEEKINDNISLTFLINGIIFGLALALLIVYLIKKNSPKKKK